MYSSLYHTLQIKSESIRCVYFCNFQSILYSHSYPVVNGDNYVIDIDKHVTSVYGSQLQIMNNDEDFHDIYSIHLKLMLFLMNYMR